MALLTHTTYHCKPLPHSADSTTVLSVGAMALAAVDEEQEVNVAIESALMDAQRASELVPSDDEYRLLGRQPTSYSSHFH